MMHSERQGDWCASHKRPAEPTFLNHANLTLPPSLTIQIVIEMKLMRINFTREILNRNIQCRWFLSSYHPKDVRRASTKIYHCLVKPYKSTIYYIRVQNRDLSVWVTETQIQLKWLGFSLYFILQQLSCNLKLVACHRNPSDALLQQCQFGWLRDLKLKQANHKIFVCCNITTKRGQLGYTACTNYFTACYFKP
jgi:hypothetical protein